jgi:protein-disulfide isomerase
MIRKYRLPVSAMVVFAAMTISPVSAQKLPAKADPPEQGITRQQAEAILGELREMRLLLEKLTKMQVAGQAPQAPPPAANVTLKLEPGSMMLGDKNAPLTMVEYIDLQCPYCRQYDEKTFAEIRKNLIDTGKLRYYSRDFPLDMHPYANKAAVAVHCAAEQGQFWRMREVLVTNAANLAPDAILGYAKTAGLDAVAFATCFGSAKYAEAIRHSISEGSAMGIQGTPSFVLGKSMADGVTGTVLVGVMPYASIEAEVKRLGSN